MGGGRRLCMLAWLMAAAVPLEARGGAAAPDVMLAQADEPEAPADDAAPAEDTGDEFEDFELDESELEDIEDAAAEIVDPWEPGPHWYGDAFPRNERVTHVHLAQPTRKGSLLFTIDHMTNQPLREDIAHDFLGFDAGSLRIGLGLRYGILDTMDVGVHRLNGAVLPFDTYEFDTKFQMLNQQEHFVDVATRGGLSWFVQEDEGDAAGGFVQLLVSRVFPWRLTIGTGLLFHSDSSNDEKSTADTDHSLAIPVIAELRIFRWLSFNTEVITSVNGYRSSHPVFTFSPQYLTNRHTFALVFSTTQFYNSDGIVTNTRRSFRDMIMGFSIIREFSL